jgi:hypothetical protein
MEGCFSQSINSTDIINVYLLLFSGGIVMKEGKEGVKGYLAGPSRVSVRTVTERDREGPCIFYGVAIGLTP